MFQRARWLMYALILTGLIGGCVGTGQVKATKDQFYKSPYVRRCLQYDKEQMSSQSEACWAQLLRRVRQEKGFVEKAELSEADLVKIRGNANRAGEQSRKLQAEMDACLKLPANQREQRIQCYREYLKRSREQLSRSQVFEVENTIATLQRAKMRAAGEVEATIERAGKLLGLRLHDETDGVRIDDGVGPPSSQAGVREQGLIVAVGANKMSELAPAERIARLEACEDAPVSLLIRYGGLKQVTFLHIEARCSEEATAKKITEVTLPIETCTGADAPELGLGVSWCYLARDGLLEVEEVCADSPAAAAGVRPGQRYLSINGSALLGKTYLQLGQMLAAFPASPLSLQEIGGTLQSPSLLNGSLLDAPARKKCWQAIESTLDRGEISGAP